MASNILERSSKVDDLGVNQHSTEHVQRYVYAYMGWVTNLRGIWQAVVVMA